MDDVWEGGVERGNSRKAQMIQEIQNLKSMGIFGGYRINAETSFEAEDEQGFFFKKGIGSLVRFNIWDPKSGLTLMTGTETREDIIRTIKRLREHPSIICWGSSTAYSLNAMHPEYAGQYFRSWEHFPLNKDSANSRKAQLLFKEMVDEIATPLDPEREVANHNGPFSKIEVATRYLTDNLDLQEREEFFDFWYWSGKNRKVIWASEWGGPFAGHQQIRFVDHQMPQANKPPKIHIENAARYFGQEMYNTPPDDEFAHWLKDNFTRQMGYEAMQQLTAINVENILKAWRTYGVNASGHHILNENVYGAQNGPHKRGADRYGFDTVKDPRIPGFSQILNSTFIPNPKLDGTPPAAAAYFRGSYFLTAYIGGPDTEFTNKDHLYFEGDSIRKQFVVINDLDNTATINGKWELISETGEVVSSGKLEGEVKPRFRAITDFPIELKAPKVTSRSDFILKVNCEETEGVILKDEFAITVFPTHQQPEVSFEGDIYYLNISDDYTHESPHFLINDENQKLIAALGLDKARLVKGLKTFEYKGASPNAGLDLQDGKGRKLVTEGTPQAGDLLIIPRFTLNSGLDDRQKNIRLLEELKFDSLVVSGLKVLVLEQAETNVMGIQAEDTRPRVSFIAANGHPVFNNLKDSDLSYWSGSSDLVQGISAYSATENRLPERMWHVSNTNSVSSKPYIRPQVGASRALAVSGFDLQETPLLEVVRGKGRIIFCQYDVSNRYGKDPAATQLLDNILQYLTTVEMPNPAKSTIKIVAEGAAVNSLPGIFRAAVPEGKSGWGITQGELFFREFIYTKATRRTTELPKGIVPVFSAKNQLGYPKVIRKNGDCFETTLYPEVFESGWMKRKVAWLHSTLIVNQGGSHQDGPQLKYHGRFTPLYPYEWIEGFVNPYTSDIW